MTVPVINLPAPNDPHFTYTLNDLIRRLTLAINAQETRVGPTTERPTDPIVGTKYFDTTVGGPVEFDGTDWLVVTVTPEA